MGHPKYLKYHFSGNMQQKGYDWFMKIDKIIHGDTFSGWIVLDTGIRGLNKTGEYYPQLGNIGQCVPLTVVDYQLLKLKKSKFNTKACVSLVEGDLGD